MKVAEVCHLSHLFGLVQVGCFVCGQCGRVGSRSRGQVRSIRTPGTSRTGVSTLRGLSEARAATSAQGRTPDTRRDSRERAANTHGALGNPGLWNPGTLQGSSKAPSRYARRRPLRGLNLSDTGKDRSLARDKRQPGQGVSRASGVTPPGRDRQRRRGGHGDPLSHCREEPAL